MNTGNNNFVRHIYKISKELKSYTVYDLVKVENSKQLLTEIARIEPFLNYSNAKNFNDYFRIKNKSSWQKSSCITGVKPTTIEGLFFGDCTRANLIGNTSKSLLFFYFDKDKKRLIVDVLWTITHTTTIYLIS
ncbi:hypothetical protein FRY74_01355 [Vicingus serpentipes]|uniref:Uncharacterized protein n=1 Tax=Vicingus serpentipes TaxID=1926625 RepID=A0A5C6RYY4_9FLAO|nr:hypothetical protein [Vicingus serpentipes]TXB66860.1 hypothetical protein FRY74_01355 [Vicingus serpentipes]